MAIVPKNWKVISNKKNDEWDEQFSRNETSLVNSPTCKRAQKYRTITRIGKNLVQKFHLAMFSIELCCLENILFCAYVLSALTWGPFHLTNLLMKWWSARILFHFTREKIHLPRQNLSEFSLFLTIQNTERPKPGQICSYYEPFWTTNKSTRSGAIPSISKTVVVVVFVVAMVVLLLYLYKRRILII